MKVTYHRKSDLLYICFDETAVQVRNEDLGESVQVEIGDGDRIVGIEILDASKRVDLTKILSVSYAEVA